MSEQNKAVVRRLVDDHWNGKNAALVSELFAPTVSLHTPDGVLTGLEGASFLLQAYATAFPDFHLTTDDLVGEADKVVLRWTFTGTHRGPLADIAASGKRVNVPNGLGIFRVVAGKVSEGRLTWNKYALPEQVGALAPRSSAAKRAAV
jgi:predicted ester cyclase